MICSDFSVICWLWGCSSSLDWAADLGSCRFRFQGPGRLKKSQERHLWFLLNPTNISSMKVLRRQPAFLYGFWWQFILLYSPWKYVIDEPCLILTAYHKYELGPIDLHWHNLKAKEIFLFTPLNFFLFKEYCLPDAPTPEVMVHLSVAITVSPHSPSCL